MNIAARGTRTHWWVLGTLSAYLLGRSSWGQCGEWEVLGQPTATRNSLIQIIAWDPDGSGDAQELLIVRPMPTPGESTVPLVSWNGDTWQDLRPLLGPYTKPLCVFQGDLLCAAGSPRQVVRVHHGLQTETIAGPEIATTAHFAVAGSAIAYVLGTAQRSNPFRYELVINSLDSQGSWAPVPADFRSSGSTVYAVRATVWNEKLVCVGAFNEVAGIPADRIAVWDGSSWQPFTPFPETNSHLTTGVFQGDLYVVGNRWARRWNNGSWEVPAQNTLPAITQWPLNAQNVAFTSTGLYMLDIGAHFDGVSWQRFDPGIANGTHFFAEWRGRLVTSASVSSSSQHNVLTVMDGQTFVPLTDGLTNAPTALTQWNGELVAAGVCGAGGRIATPAIRWSGNSWHNIGERPQGAPPCDAATAARVWSNALVVGFSGAPGHALWRFDGFTWAPFTASPWSSIQHIAVVNDQLIVKGRVGSASRLAAWTGVDWIDLVSSTEAGTVIAMTNAGGRLVIAGTFTHIGNVEASKVAAWDGVQWSGFGGGPIGVERLGVYRGQPVAGTTSTWSWWNGSEWIDVVGVDGGTSTSGSFAELNGDCINSSLFPKRWSPDFGMRPLGQDETATYGSASQSETIGGTLYATMGSLQPLDVLSVLCASWRDTPTCDCDSIDFNRDNLFPDIADIPDFLSVFQGGLCARQLLTAEGPCNSDIDFNNDGLFPDTLDIQAFLSVFSGGECVQ